MKKMINATGFTWGLAENMHLFIQTHRNSGWETSSVFNVTRLETVENLITSDDIFAIETRNSIYIVSAEKQIPM